MATPQVTEDAAGDREAYAGVVRFYELAKKQEWQVRDLPWGDVPPIPETSKGTPQKRARRLDVWRSVVTQQLQADELACEMSSQLLNIAPDPEAKLYYSTMVQDESRHTEAWLKLAAEAGGTSERDPHLDTLAHQVLEDLCNRLTVDDGIHHGAGMAYERVLLESASEKTKRQLVDAANRLLPVFVAHALWRPQERAWIGRAMESRDVHRLREDIELGVRLAGSLGLDVSEIQLPVG